MALTAVFLALIFSIQKLLVNSNNCTMVPAGSTVQVNKTETITIGETVANHCIINGGLAVTYYCPSKGDKGHVKVYEGNECDGHAVEYDVKILGKCYSDYCIGYNDVECALQSDCWNSLVSKCHCPFMIRSSIRDQIVGERWYTTPLSIIRGQLWVNAFRSMLLMRRSRSFSAVLMVSQ